MQKINVELWMTGFKARVLKRKMNVALGRDFMKTRPAKISLVFFASVSKISAHNYNFLEPGTGKVGKTRPHPSMI